MPLMPRGRPGGNRYLSRGVGQFYFGKKIFSLCLKNVKTSLNPILTKKYPCATLILAYEEGKDIVANPGGKNRT
jgi:hypothetical protein